MKRKIYGLLAVLGLCGVAAARTVDIANWDFTAPNGSSLSNAVDSINGYYFPDAEGVMISNNAVFVDGGSSTNDTYVDTQIETVSDGKIRLTWDVLAFSTLSAGQASFAIKNPSNDTLLASFRFDSANSKLRLATYYLKPDGEYQWAYTRWLGGVPTIDETLHMGMEYDIETGSLSVQWAGPDTGGKEYAVMPSPVGYLELQATISKMAADDHVFLDNLHVSRIPAPSGAQIQDSATAEVTNTAPWSIASFDATNGDYVAVIVASNAGDNPGETSVTVSGAVDQVTYQPAIAEGPGSFLWYAPVTNAGQVDIAYQAVAAIDKSHHIVGAYLIRSTSGELEPPVFASVTGAGAGEASLTYAVPSKSDGVFLEAFSAYKAASPQNPDTAVDLSQWGQRTVAHGTFWGLTELTNTWTTGDSGYALLGLLFTGVQNDTPEKLLYNDWIVAYPGVGDASAMTNNPDGDSLDNLAEYAFGGDPSDPSDQGYVAQESLVDDAGTAYVEYVYAKRSDAADRGLTYSLELNSDLVFGSWTNTGYVETGIGSGAFGEGFDAITNRIPAAESKKFIRVQVEFND